MHPPRSRKTGKPLLLKEFYENTELELGMHTPSKEEICFLCLLWKTGKQTENQGT